jgi:DNA uptake protein ComE-like DNA-binding protein
MTAPPPRLSWSASRAALILLAALLLVASLSLWRARAGRFEHDGTLKGHPELQAQIRQTIDPNTASAASLCRLPGIGPTRAQQIILYRQQQASAQQNGETPKPFQTAADLQRVPGLGIGTARRVAPFLSIPNDVNH